MVSVYILLFILGLAVGSFLNVLIYRLPRNLSIFGRSFCPNCRKTISWHDNIPIVSFVILKGLCRHCHSPISFQYPIVEFVTGLLFVLTFVMFQKEHLLSIIYYLFIISSLIVVFFTDLKYGIIPDKIIFPATLASLLFSLLGRSILSAIGASLFLLVLSLITKGRGMGLGDVKLAFLMGLFLGWPSVLLALYFSFLTGGIVSALLLLKGIKRIGQTIPFGPFLVLGTMMAFFFGEKIIETFNLTALLP